MDKDWFPSREADLRLFLQNLVKVIPQVEILMGVPPGTFKPLQDFAQAQLDAFDVRDNARTALDTAQTDLETQAGLTETGLRAGVREIKNKQNLPTEVLDLLHLNTPDTKPEQRVAAEAPLLKPRMEGIHPAIAGNKYGHDAIEIWCRRDGEPEFKHLATVTHLPYYDNRPNVEPDRTEQRSYYGYYQKRNVVVSPKGKTSDLLVPGGNHQ